MDSQKISSLTALSVILHSVIIWTDVLYNNHLATRSHASSVFYWYQEYPVYIIFFFFFFTIFQFYTLMKIAEIIFYPSFVLLGLYISEKYCHELDYKYIITIFGLSILSNQKLNKIFFLVVNFLLILLKIWRYAPFARKSDLHTGYITKLAFYLILTHIF